MAKTYYLIESLGRKFIVNGTAVPFEPLDGDQGVIVLDDTDPQQKAFSEALTKSEGRFGIVKISEGEYGSKKENHPWSAFVSRSKEQAQRNRIEAFPSAQQVDPLRKKSLAAAAAPSKLTRATIAQAAAALTEPAAATTPDPLGETTSFKPATGRPRGRPPKEKVAE